MQASGPTTSTEETTSTEATAPPKIQDIIVSSTSRIFYGRESSRAVGQFGVVSNDAENNNNDKYFSPPPNIFGGRFSKTKEEIDKEGERILNTIKELLIHAQHSREHLPEHERENIITRVVTNEFSFFTEKPLTVEEFEALQQEVYSLINKVENQNIHLVLSSFVVLTPDSSKIMNVVPYFQCGEVPDVNFIVKHKPSSFDPMYSNLNQPGADYQWVRDAFENDKKLIAETFIEANRYSSAFISFHNVIKCMAASGSTFYCGIDICLDHKSGKAKESLAMRLLLERLLIKKEESIPLLYQTCGYSEEVQQLADLIQYYNETDHTELRKALELLKKLNPSLDEIENLKVQPEVLENLKAQVKEFEDLKAQAARFEKLQSQPAELEKLKAQPEEFEKLQAQAKKFQILKTQTLMFMRLQKQSENLEKLNNQAKEYIKLKERSENFQKLLKELEKQSPSPFAFCSHIVTSNTVDLVPTHAIGEIVTHADPKTPFPKVRLNNKTFEEIKAEEGQQHVTRIKVEFGAPALEIISTSLQEDELAKLKREGIINDGYLELPTEEHYENFILKFPNIDQQVTPPSSVELEASIQKDTKEGGNQDIPKITIEVGFGSPYLKVITTPPISCNQCSLSTLTRASPSLSQSLADEKDNSKEQTPKATQESAPPILSYYNMQQRRSGENNSQQTVESKPNSSFEHTQQKNGM